MFGVILVAFSACNDDPGSGDETCPRVAPPAGAAPVASGEVGYTLPAPSGPYAVGTHVLHVTDDQRSEDATPDPADRRELVVQLFYPIDASDAGAASPLFDDAEAQVVWGPDLDIAARAIAGHATRDAPLSEAQARWPVVVYSHGIGSNRSDNRALLESLASHGLVVAAISHSFYDRGTTLANGHITDHEAMPADGVLTEPFLDVAQAIWRDDQRAVLAELEALADTRTCTFLSGRLDLDRLAFIGYSFGGSTAYQSCAHEPRCRAAVALDSVFFGALAAPLAAPFLHISQRRVDTSWALVAGRSTAETATLWIEGTTHVDFGGVSAALPALGVDPQAYGYGPLGSLAPGRAEAILRTWAEAFITAHLLEDPTFDALVAAVGDDYPETFFERVSPDGAAAAPRVLGRTSVVPTGAGVPDAAVTIGESADTTDAAGSWLSAPLGADELVRVDVTHPSYLPWSSTVQLRARSVVLETPMIAPQLVPVVLSPTDLQAEAGRGHVLVSGLRTPPGLTVTTAGASTLYLAPSNIVDPELTATGAAQLALVPNLAPGMHELVLAHPSRSCSAPLSPTGPAGGVLTEVLPDGVAQVFVVCEPR